MRASLPRRFRSEGGPSTVPGPGRALLGAVLLVLLPAPLPASPPRQPPPFAAASTAVVADLLNRLAGEDRSVVSLAGWGAHPRLGEPSLEAVEAAAAARLYVRVGAAFEGRADRRLLEEERTGLLVVDLSDTVAFRGLPPGDTAERKILSAALGLDSGDIEKANPFFWLDPLLAARAVDAMADSLVSVDPGGAAAYRERASRLRGELEALDSEIRSRLEAVGDGPFVTFSRAWSYFADRYGLREVAASGPAPGGGPARRTLKGTVERIRSLGVRALFTDQTFPRRPAEEAAARSGARLVVLEPFGTPEEAGYFPMMRRNLRLIERGLKGDGDGGR